MRRRLPLITFLLAALAVLGVTTASATVGPIGFSGSDPIQFGSVQVGTNSSATTVTITNSGDLDSGPLHLGGVDAAAFGLSGSTCAGAVPAFGSCTVDVTFSPGPSTGQYNAALEVLDPNDSTSVVGSTGLTGNGTPAPAPALTVQNPTPVAFGNQKVGTTSAAVDLIVKNTGNADLNVVGAGSSDPQFSVTNNACIGASPIAPGGTCAISVTFSPTSSGGASAVLSVSSNDPASPTPVSLSGNGTVPVASLPDSVSFASPQGTPQSLNVTLTNTGDATLVVNGIAGLSGDGEFAKDMQLSNCGNATLAPHGGSCNVVIIFTPSDLLPKSATLSFDDDASPSPQTVQLTGTTLIPGIASNPTSIGFEQLPVGRLSSPITAVITNKGDANLHITSVAIGGLNYKSFQLGLESCTQAAIAPGNTCTVRVRFSPTQLGSRIATLLLKNDAGGSASTLGVALTGNGARPASVTALRAAAGCSDARLTWRNPDATGFLRVQVVRNSAHTPRGPFDGVIIRHTTGSLTDTGLTQFQGYHYALYAVYTSFDHSRVAYSAGSVAGLRTGRICTPRNGSLIADLSPPVDWTGYSGARYYAYILQRSGHTILVRYPKRSQTTLPSSWKFNGQSRSIQHGGTYSFYLYTYTRARPNGFLIGQTVFTER